MPRYQISDEIVWMLSASGFLRLLKDGAQRTNILKSKYIPPVLGSDSLGTYKVVLKHEPKQKSKFYTTIK
jgi:hypothetical protein